MHTLTCRMCGKEFISIRRNTKYCSSNCNERSKYIAMKHEIENLNDFINGVTEPFVNHSNLVTNAMAAKKARMSYGYYMAMKAGRL